MKNIKKVCLIFLFTVFSGYSHGQNFFGVNLDEEGDQIKKLHDLLMAGKVEVGGRVLREWTPQSYDTLDGEGVAFVYNQGDNELIRRQWDELNTEFERKFTESKHYVTEEWIPLDELGENDWIPWEKKGELYAYEDIFSYGNYRIGINYFIFSTTRNRANPDSAELIIFLGINSKYCY